MSTPWMKFYPTDWRADPALRMCSLLARGLWMEMLCIMHEATPRGALRVNGRGMTDRQLASLSGATIDEVAAALVELEDAGVFSRDDEGVPFSRRMQRDDAKAARDKANGSKGGNPDLVGDKGGVNPEDKAQKPEARIPEQEEERTLANANDGADAPPLSAKDELWLNSVQPLADLSGKSPTAVRSWIGKALKEFTAEEVLRAVNAAIAEKSGDPFAYARRVLVPNPKARASPKPDCTDASTDLVEEIQNGTFARPVAGPMLTAIRGGAH